MTNILVKLNSKYQQRDFFSAKQWCSIEQLSICF